MSEIVRTDSPTTRTSSPICVRYFPTALQRALSPEIRRPSAAAGDHRHAGRQPDGQPVGHLVRQPHDRGHRRRCRRRHPCLGRGARHLRLRPPMWERDRGRRRRTSSSTRSSTCSSSCGGWSSGARCGCCATAVRRWTSPPSSPSSSRASASCRRRWSRHLRGRMRDQLFAQRGGAAGSRRARALAAALRAVAADAHRLRRHRARPAASDLAVREAAAAYWDVFDALDARVAVGRASARCRATTAGRRRPARLCATI